MIIGRNEKTLIWFVLCLFLAACLTSCGGESESYKTDVTPTNQPTSDKKEYKAQPVYGEMHSLQSIKNYYPTSYQSSRLLVTKDSYILLHALAHATEGNFGSYDSMLILPNATCRYKGLSSEKDPTKAENIELGKVARGYSCLWKRGTKKGERFKLRRGDEIIWVVNGSPQHGKITGVVSFELL